MIFTQLQSGVVVLKAGSHSLASELYATLISQACGVYSPRILVQRNSPSETLVDSFMNALSRKDPNMILSRMHDQRFVMIMEFCVGWSIGKLSQLDSVTDYSHMVHTLGQIVALDVLLNNGDRVPFIWDNQGNSGNLHLIVRQDDNSVDLANIDPGIRAIDATKFPDEHQAYLDLVTKTVGTVVAYSKQGELAEVPKLFQHLL